MPRLLSLLALAGLLGASLACEGGPDAPAVETVTPEAVERYRTGVILELQDVDDAIAALETTAEQADSAAAATYGRALEDIRRERQQIQTDLDALHGTTTEAFEASTDSIDAEIDVLAARVDLAPIELAPDAASLRQAALARLAALDAEVQEDSTLQQASAEFLQRRQQIEGALARLGAPEASFPAIRAEVARLFAALEERLDALRSGEGAPSAPDTTALG